MAELVLDVVEHILINLDAIDLLRYKLVCKSWLSLISSPLFAKAHFNQTFIKKTKQNNSIDDKKRIIMHNGCHQSLDGSFICNDYHIIGSSNGLVCISPRDFDLLVTNPLTREVSYLPMLPNEVFADKTVGRFVSKPCWGFGYDLVTDDWKVVVGFGIGVCRTRFYVLALKSSIWRLIGDVKYKMEFGQVARPGVLCEGSLHWFMNDRRNKKVIICFDLCLEEFKEIPQPDDLLYECNDDDKLGFVEESLCIYRHQAPSNRTLGNGSVRDTRVRPMKWIMRDYQVTESWEQAPYCCDEMDVDPHYLRNLEYISHKSSDYCRSLRIMDYMATPVFVPSLVSPPGNVQKLIKTNIGKRARKRKRRHAKNSKRKAKSTKKDHLAPGLSARV